MTTTGRLPCMGRAELSTVSCQWDLSWPLPQPALKWQAVLLFAVLRWLPVACCCCAAPPSPAMRCSWCSVTASGAMGKMLPYPTAACASHGPARSHPTALAPAPAPAHSDTGNVFADTNGKAPIPSRCVRDCCVRLKRALPQQPAAASRLFRHTRHLHHCCTHTQVLQGPLQQRACVCREGAGGAAHPSPQLRAWRGEGLPWRRHTDAV